MSTSVYLFASGVLLLAAAVMNAFGYEHTAIAFLVIAVACLLLERRVHRESS